MAYEQIIFTKSGMNRVRREFYVGMEIPVYNENILTEDHTPQLEYIHITEMHRDFVQVTNGRYKWCIRYLDLLDMIHPATR